MSAPDMSGNAPSLHDLEIKRVLDRGSNRGEERA